MKKEYVIYGDKEATLEGFLVYDETKMKKHPGVILCHAWRGRDEFICEKAVEVASWGYVAFALDLYGKGVFGHNTAENVALMTPFIQDRLFLQGRLKASLDTFKKQSPVDENNIAAMGFCFGGLCALDYARWNQGLKGVISVHGILSSPERLERKKITSKVLALHGHDDPMVPPEAVLAFEREMTAAQADWQVHVYGQTMHAFTNPMANDPGFGTVYNPVSSHRAWKSIKSFLKECLE